jgi:hypothetical protein
VTPVAAGGFLSCVAYALLQFVDGLLPLRSIHFWASLRHFRHLAGVQAAADTLNSRRRVRSRRHPFTTNFSMALRISFDPRAAIGAYGKVHVERDDRVEFMFKATGSRCAAHW